MSKFNLKCKFWRCLTRKIFFFLHWFWFSCWSTTSSLHISCFFKFFYDLEVLGDSGNGGTYIFVAYQNNDEEPMVNKLKASYLKCTMSTNCNWVEQNVTHRNQGFSQVMVQMQFSIPFEKEFQGALLVDQTLELDVRIPTTLETWNVMNEYQKNAHERAWLCLERATITQVSSKLYETFPQIFCPWTSN